MNVTPSLALRQINQTLHMISNGYSYQILQNNFAGMRYPAISSKYELCKKAIILFSIGTQLVAQPNIYLYEPDYVKSNEIVLCFALGI